MPSVRQLLHKEDPYQGFAPYDSDLYGWGSDDPNFARVIDEVKPTLILEVGAWMGASALHMAKLAPNAEVVCIDTWSGAVDWWTDFDNAERYPKLRLVNGYPNAYYGFLSNVVHAGKQHQITPFPVPSTVAAQVLEQLGVIADLIYIDSSHEYRDVLLDLEDYWTLLRPGGILFGDDLRYSPFPGVKLAVEVFCYTHNLIYEDCDRQWVIRK